MAIEEEMPESQSPVSSNQNQNDSEVFENKLRPKDFSKYIGQKDVINNLKVFLQAAKNRNETLDHAIFHGPPGLGKTTLSMILAQEMDAQLKVTSGPALEKPGDLASILSNLQEGDFLFIDEIHRLRMPVEEILYTAMEDFSIDIVIGKGPSARTMRLNVPQFTLIGATTQISKISNPLRDRFGHVERLRFYEDDEVQKILQQSAQILEVDMEESASQILAKSCRRTPRIANRLLRRMRDFADVLYDGIITQKVVLESLKNLSVDHKGLDFSDQEYLKILCNNFQGGPVGLSTLASALGEDESTIEDVIEPFLIREGFLQKTPRGRVVTDLGFQHMGIININPKNNLF